MLAQSQTCTKPTREVQESHSRIARARAEGGSGFCTAVARFEEVAGVQGRGELLDLSRGVDTFVSTLQVC